MEKEQSKLVAKSEIKKDRVAGFPFHLVSTTYSTQDLHFIIAADNVSQVLTVYPYKSDMTKMITSTVPLTNILAKKFIATIYVVSLTVKPSNTSVIIEHAEFIIGYRTGQLIEIEYKDKECRVKYRYNKALKGESFFSRASSAFFGNDQHYNPFFAAPIRSFSVNPPLLPNHYFIWQVGNNIFLQKQLSQSKESKFFARYQAVNLENFHLNYDLNKTIKQGNTMLYGCEQYTVMQFPELAMTLIAFRSQISSFTPLSEKKELVVALSAKEVILVIDFNHFVVKSRITTEMPMRRLSSFQLKGQTFIACMPYQNYLILYSLSSNSYCKLKGHRSFIANAYFHQTNQRIITAGMDHQICLMKLNSIKQQNWIAAEKQAEGWKIKQYDVKQQKFQDVYRLGEANSTRSNLYNYGYAGLFVLNGHFCFPTYDCKIVIYAL